MAFLGYPSLPLLNWTGLFKHASFVHLMEFQSLLYRFMSLSVA